MLCLSLAGGGLVAFTGASCASSDQGSDYDPFAPAGSQERAQARREREARANALASITAKPDAGKPPKVVPKKKPAAPLPSATAVADAGAPEPADATTDAGVADAASDAGSPAPSAGDLCDKLCGRVVACAKEMMGNAPPGMGPSIMGDMVDKMAKECSEECAKEVKDADASRIAKGKACLAAPDCDDFMTCMRELRSKDD